MATITSVTASPTTLASSGATSAIAVTVSNPDKLATVTVSVDGSEGTAQVTLHEALVYSVDPADVGKPGHVVATVDAGGTLAVGPDGISFVLTAS